MSVAWISWTEASKVKDANCRTRIPGPIASVCRATSTRFDRPRCSIKVPFGLPVDPDV
jgi:hypothetical protein